MIGDPYATITELTTYLFKQQETKATQLYESDLTDALNSATEEINRFCHRQFNQQTAPSVRVYEPQTLKRCLVDDFWTTTGLLISSDPGGTGNFTQIWDPSGDVEMYPYNGVVAGMPGWPWNELRACRGLFFPKYFPNPYRRRAVVQVTASWGWAAVPAPVHQACLIIAAQRWKLRDAPFGVAGSKAPGANMPLLSSSKASSIQTAQQMLQPFVLRPVQIG